MNGVCNHFSRPKATGRPLITPMTKYIQIFPANYASWQFQKFNSSKLVVAGCHLRGTGWQIKQSKWDLCPNVETHCSSLACWKRSLANRLKHRSFEVLFIIRNWNRLGAAFKRMYQYHMAHLQQAFRLVRMDLGRVRRRAHLAGLRMDSACLMPSETSATLG